jgi:sodium/proline symporter
LDNYNIWLVISFVAYTLGIVTIGLYSSRLRKKTSDDFVLANRELGPWVAALSASASSESGWVMIGLVGEAYLYGAAAFWIVPGIAAGYLFNWYVIAERLRRVTTESGAVTLPQYILERYGKDSSALRIISVLIIVAAMLTYVAAQMNAAGKAFEATFHLPYIWGVLVGAVVILTYTVTGGFRAICWTDVVQAAFMVIALVGMPIIMLDQLGGFEHFFEAVPRVDPDLLTFSYGKTGFAMLGFVVGMLGIGLGYPGQPHVLSRFMATKDTKSVRQGAKIALVWMVLAYLGAISFGLLAKTWNSGLADPEQALPLACVQLLPALLAGFFVAAIVAAICSTADSQLMVVSSTISRDVLPLLRKRTAGKLSATAETLLGIDRAVLLILGILAAALAAQQSRVIFHFVLYAWSAMGAAFGPVVILGLLWKRANKPGAIAGMLTGLIVTVVWRETPLLKAATDEWTPAFVLAFLAVWVVSLVTRPPGSVSRPDPGGNLQ